MPRKLRIEYPGAMYHVMSRGNRRQDIFLDDVDRHDFLKTLAEACQKTGWQVHAYCLMEARRLEPGDEAALTVFRRGWYVGSEVFRQEQLARMEGKLGEHHAGQLRRETAEAKGERIIAEELRRLGWSERDLAIRRKNAPDRVAIAVRLRREATLSIKTIAARVHLGTSNTANARLHRAMKELVAAGSGQGAFGI